MSEKVKTKVAELLKNNTIKGFLGLARRYGHTAPHLFTDPEQLDDLVVGDGERPGDSRYPLNKTLVRLARRYPQDTFGVLVRGCDERGLNALYTWNQLQQDKVVPVGIVCPQELADACECEKPFAESSVEGDGATARSFASVERIDALDLVERFSFWEKEFYKCIKCYGCRNVCPMCFCKECTLEDKNLVATDELPPEIPVFHLTRAMHMAGRCIDCGLCSEACPSDIPLRTLYKKVAAVLESDFGYKTGFAAMEKSPLNLLGPAN